MAANDTRIVLTAEDKTAAAFASVKGHLQGLEAQSALASRALGAIGVTFSAAAAVALVKGAIDAADGFHDLSQRVGINIQALAGWQLAANQSGTSIESVAKGIKGLSGYMVDHADRLKAAGVTATDANGAMIQLADIFAAMPDGVEKTALAVQLFGKAGMDMIPMLNLGSKGLAEAQEKAAAYGRKMAELAPLAAQFNDEMEELALNSKAAGINIATYLIGPMTNLAKGLGDIAAGGERMWAVLQKMGNAGNPLANQLLASRAILSPEAGRSANGWELAGLDPKTGQPKAAGMMLPGANSTAEREALEKSRILNPSGGGRGAAAARPRRAFDPEGDLAYAMEESQRKAHRDWVIAQQKEEDTLEARAKAMDEKHMARMEAYRIETEGEEAVREEMEKTTRAAEKALGETTEFAREAARNMQDAMADGFFNIMQGKFDNLGDQFKSTLDRMVANAMAANLGKYLLGDFGKGGDLGGVVGKFLGSTGGGGGNPDEAGSGLLGMISKWIPKFAEGTDFVPRTGLAVVHQGERIIPAAQNKPGAGGLSVVMNFAITGPADRRTQEQLAAMAGLGIQRALARNA